MDGMAESYTGGSSPYGSGQGGSFAGNGNAFGQAAAKTPRPENFDAWTDADFISAAREHDPLVLDAIDFKVKSAPGDAGVAVLLTSLLDLPPLPAQTNASGAAAGYQGMIDANGSGSLYPGSSLPGAGDPRSSAPAGAQRGVPGKGGMPGGGNSGAAPSLSPPSPQLSAPQSLLGKPKNGHLGVATTDPRGAIDSVSAMILEAAVTYMPQGPGVGAIAGGAAGRIEGFGGQAPGNTTTPKSMPGAAMPGGAASDGAMLGGAMPGGATMPGAAMPGATMPGGGMLGGEMPGGNYPGGGYPGGGYPGGGYPGGDGQGLNGSPNVGQLQDRMLVSKVVDGLIANNSQEAWQSVFGIVAGTVKTPMPQEANCEIVVERLVQNMDSNSDVIQPVILAFLDDATPIPPESRTACLRMLAAISAAETDVLTGFGTSESLSGGAIGENGGFPGGFGDAGSSFAGGGLGNLEMSGAGGFPGMNGAGPGMNGVGGYPGMNGRGQPGMGGLGGNAAVSGKSSLPQISLEPDVVARGAEFLWSPKSVAAIVSQLEKTADLTTATDVLMLASTIPGTVVRNAICETLLRLHPSGADGLNASGFFSDVHDPGMLVIMKSLPRTRPSKDAPGAMDSWTSGTESLVLALRDELNRASGSMQPFTGTLPVKLHKNATAEVAVMMQMPTGASPQSSDAIPAVTTVYYTRTIFTPHKKRDTDDLTSHYESRTSGYSRPDVAKGVMWIEGVKVLPNGHRRTLDVVIEKVGGSAANQQMGFAGGGGPGGMMETGPGPGGGGGGGLGGSYTVEIIVVDTLDPKNASPAATTQAAASP